MTQRTGHARPPAEPLGSGSSRRLLFSALSTPDVTRAVVQRLRAAVGLGLLADGDRLPKESDLAQMLGVSNFTLRAALETLRDEGLIITRPGKRGGSFITAAATVEQLALDDLRDMSATELRDLGDWRQTLASAAAALAARRASKSTSTRLHVLAGEVAAAPTDAQLRRAYGRFHIELAAAAQSTRLSRAEFAVHEEFDWLLSLSLSDQEVRRQASAELADIATAVARRRPEAARLAAERHSASTTEALMKLRLGAIASAGGGVGGHGTARALADEVRRIVELLTEQLDAIANGAEDTHRRPALDEAGLRQRLSAATMSALINIDFPVHGMGFIAEPATVPGHQFWMDWWRRGPQGVLPDAQHVLDPDRDDFYDYASRDYFALPRADGRRWVEGPYVDFGGVDDYVLTFSRPAYAEGRFIGVAAADVLIADLERQLAPWLVMSRSPRMIINNERRVIMSNVATLIVGDVVPSTSDFDMLPIDEFGWCVASAPSLRVKR